MEMKEGIPPDSPAETGAGQPWSCLFRWHFVVLLAVIVFFSAIRWRLVDIPLERDEGEYAYAGQLILQGIPPYQLAYNMKLPGTFLAYAAILATLGQTARGIHLGLLFINAISVILLYVVTAQLFGSLAGTIAGASYALFSTHPGVVGFAAHATHFVVLGTLIGLILMLRAEETGRTAFFFWSGLAFGIAFLMKQPGILLGAFAFFYLAVQSWPHNQREWEPWVRKLFFFLLAGALPFAVTCALLWRAGLFQNFWFWTFSYANQYATTVSFHTGLENLTASSSDLLRLTRELLILAFVGVCTAFWDATVRRHAAFVFGLLAFSCAAVCPGLYFREHYFVLMLPAVAILIAVAVTSTMRLLATARWLTVLPVIVFAAAWVLAVHRNADIYFKLTPFQVCRLRYKTNPFWEAPQIAEYVRQHTAPTDTIMVFGSEPEIYFYAHRHSASGFIYIYSLMEDQPYWRVMQKQMMQEVEANRPAYAIFVSIPFSWLFRAGSPQVVALDNWMTQYISSGFEEVGMVELAETESHYFWGNEIPGHDRPDLEVRIYKRKD